MATRPAPNSGADAPFSLADVQALLRPATDMDEFTSFLIYGRPKSGKTWLSASSGLPTIHIDCRDIGTETLATHPYAKVIKKYQMTEYPAALDRIFWLLRTQKHPFKVAVLDNWTTLAEIVMNNILGPRARDLDFIMPTKGNHWNHQTQILENIFFEWRDLIDRMHVVFLAEERTFTVGNEDGTEMVEEVGAAVGPSFRRTLEAGVSTIGRLYTEEVNDPENEGQKKTVRRLLLGPEPKYAAGSRIKGLPHVMKGPTLRKILDIRASRGEAASMDEEVEAPAAAQNETAEAATTAVADL